MQTVIRNAVDTDIPTLCKIDALDRGRSYNLHYWIENLITEYSFVALHDDIIIGYVASNDIYIFSFDVLKEYRNQGIGRSLLEKCIQSHESYISLHVRISNDNALHLYQTIGFKIIGIIPKYYSDPVEDGYVMELMKI